MCISVYVDRTMCKLAEASSAANVLTIMCTRSNNGQVCIGTRTDEHDQQRTHAHIDEENDETLNACQTAGTPYHSVRTVHACPFPRTCRPCAPSSAHRSPCRTGVTLRITTNAHYGERARAHSPIHIHTLDQAHTAWMHTSRAANSADRVRFRFLCA
jgi:hypothetical protein